MKIVIAVILIALIFFLFRKFTAGKTTSEQPSSNDSLTSAEATATTVAEKTHSAAEKTVDSTTAAAAAAGTAVAGAVAAATAEVTSTNTSGVTESATSAPSPPAAGSSLPIEHLEGVDRQTGKTLRGLGIKDTVSLLNASEDTLEAAGIDQAAAKLLQAQASLSALPDATPSEISALANSGIDSIKSLAQQTPEQLLTIVARTNRGSATLKSAPGVQQLQRLISRAKAVA